MKWQGSVAVITGASRGIGRAVARAAAERGAKVGLLARSKEDLERVLAEIGGRGAVAVADVGDRRETEEALASIARELGPIDILVNNAGIGSYGLFAETDPDLFERLMRVNYLGTVYAMQAVLPGMIERRRGHIVNIGSIAGRLGAPFEAAYSATKFAVSGLSEAVAVEVHKHGVRVSLVSPGPVATDFFEARGHAYSRDVPKPVPPERIASAVIAAVERNILEQFIPRWLRQAWMIRVTVPRGYLTGTLKAFKKELS